MRDGRLVVALDVGGHAARAQVYDLAGALLSRAERPVITRRDGALVEHDAEALAGTVQAVLD
jgi:ribulose kinase